MKESLYLRLISLKGPSFGRKLIVRLTKYHGLINKCISRMGLTEGVSQKCIVLGHT